MFSNHYLNYADDVLLTLMQQSDEKAFETIYRRHWYKMYQVAFQFMGSKEDSEQIVQDAFESLWKRREMLEVRQLKVYLVVVVKNLATNMIKSQITFRKYQEFLIFRKIEQTGNVENISNFEELAAAVDDALRKLPEKTAEVFRLSRFENMPNREIAVMLHLSEKAVEYHITKSLKFLKMELKPFHSDN
jgi:RNA polymerase sigma-70 factor (family 1)